MTSALYWLMIARRTSQSSPCFTMPSCGTSRSCSDSSNAFISWRAPSSTPSSTIGRLSGEPTSRLQEESHGRREPCRHNSSRSRQRTRSPHLKLLRSRLQAPRSGVGFERQRWFGSCCFYILKPMPPMLKRRSQVLASEWCGEQLHCVGSGD